MSKSAKQFLPVAAAIAIPFAAGPLGVALGGSALLAGSSLGVFLGTAGGAAVLGGLMGAGVGALSGGGLTGALIGGATGAFGGYAGAGGLAGLGQAAPVATEGALAGTASATAPVTATTGAAPLIKAAELAAPVAADGAGLAVPTVTGAELASAAPGVLTGTAPATGVLTGTPTLDVTAAGGGLNTAGTLGRLGRPENLMPLMQAGMQIATADTGLTDAEQAAYNAQIAELERQGRDAEAIQLRQEQQAREYEQTVRQQGPRTAEAYAAGQLAAERELQSGLRTAGVQGYSPQQLAAMQRSGSILGSQTAATRAATEQARGEGALRAGLTQVASMYPTQPTVQAAPAARFQAAQTLAQREEDLYSGLGETVSGIAGRISGQTEGGQYTLYPTA